MKKCFSIILPTLCAVALTSCLFVSDSTYNRTVYQLYDFTANLAALSLDGPVNALNGAADSVLFDDGFGQKEMSGSGISFTITRVSDSLWRAVCEDPASLSFETELRMLPENSDIMGIRKHDWAVITRGTYKEDSYSATFATVSDKYVYSWTSSDSGSLVIVRKVCKGAFRIETWLDTKQLDYGVLYTDGDDLSFDSSMGNFTPYEPDYYME